MPKFRTSSRVVSAIEASYTTEAALVQSRAERREPSVVRLGQVLFFSTATGDAWMLDLADGQAAALARAGERLPVPIEESPRKFLVAWQTRFRIEEDAFLVAEEDGSMRTCDGYPVEEIQKMMAAHPVEDRSRTWRAFEAQERLQRVGRNEPCPCGSGRKYKKCCLPLDEQAARLASQPGHRAELETDDEIAPIAPAELADEPELSSEAEAELDRIWDELGSKKILTTAQLDALLDRLLALPHAATQWSEVLDVLAEKRHADLPGAFRRMAAVLRPSKEGASSYFYWNAIEKFAQSGRTDLVPEIVHGMCRLDRENYDADALRHVAYWALAAGCEAEALALEEHFLPILRADDELMAYAVSETCRRIFELRVGRAAAVNPGVDADATSALAGELRRGIEEEIHVEFTERAAQVIRAERDARAWKREDFALSTREIEEGTRAWSAALDCFEALLNVAREATRHAGRPGGIVFHALWLVADAVCAERDERREKSRGPASPNLLDCLQPSGMERRIAQNARGMLGTDTPQAHLLLDAHTDLLRFAAHHGLIDEKLAAKIAANIAMLKEKLGFDAVA